ncbi:Pyruvate formate-lyase activating enzyme family protein [Methanonatronarchaeum thermophilum]|uniref:Pyruvate formate-lyase activating enzyme family protein n=1 Tax=Methanonatronarchaeum thermophilum TaxID=1927129 RepID=A0A1Y3GGA2_9EURY|nr:radical SAM protein [Methanonatronarchaeum thermophilum]OUJ19234.1 Pyruvate formate-lyase activating enzyme family protein [Methanonatronarchaeum thermophilum]
MENNNKSISTGEIATGCKHCRKGAKAVLFLTGICDQNCYYCPISKKRKNKDKTWINEKLVKTPKDVFIEIENMNATGTGITGGEPLLKQKKLFKYIKTLKNRYGGDHHIHLYTSKPPKTKTIKKLSKHGLDEIRYHIKNLNLQPYLKPIKQSTKHMETGIEIPAIPNKTREIQKIINQTHQHIDFYNLNEFEYSETNYNKIKQKNHKPIGETTHAIKNSRETATKIINQNQNKPIHFCTSNYKDSIQLRKRLQRTAKQKAKPYDEITKDGTLIRAIITGKPPKQTKKILKTQYNVPKNKIGQHKQKTETAWWIADQIHIELQTKHQLKTDIIEIYPTSNRFQVQKIPLNKKENKNKKEK